MTWIHPVSKREVQFAAATIERWYYILLRERDDPMRALRRAVRKDCGKVSLAPALAERLHIQYRDHPHWSYQLHYDNLAALVQAEPALGRAALLFHREALHAALTAGCASRGWSRHDAPAKCAPKRDARRARSAASKLRSPGPCGTSISTTHHSRCVTPDGQWVRPIALGILDDHSRLCCHVQWYLSETAEDLVHGLSQAIQKRGLPRALLTDNGSAMVAEEVTEGLLRLGIVHERTLPCSPYQNGKQEVFWGTLEGRLMRMLDGVGNLTLELLNEATQAWVEMEYNRSVHSETSSSPVERFAQSLHVLRSSPSSESLRDAFRLDTRRRQRQSDGTISLEGVRFEIPARYRHFREVAVRYARWDLGRVDLVDPRKDTILAPIYPLDKSANADGRRAFVEARGHRHAGQSVRRGQEQQRRAATAPEATPPGVLRHGIAAGVFAQDATTLLGRIIMNAKQMLSLCGLKWNPFSPELPTEALLVTPKIEHFAWRVEQLVQEGGFAMITG